MWPTSNVELMVMRLSRYLIFNENHVSDWESAFSDFSRLLKLAQFSFEISVLRKLSSVLYLKRPYKNGREKSRKGESKQACSCAWNSIYFVHTCWTVSNYLTVRFWPGISERLSFYDSTVIDRYVFYSIWTKPHMWCFDGIKQFQKLHCWPEEGTGLLEPSWSKWDLLEVALERVSYHGLTVDCNPC